MALSPPRRFHLSWGAVLGRAPAPMLAQLEKELPAGLNWRYEPKLDGFRGLLWRRSASQVQLLSRNSRDLAPWFPELSLAAKALPPNTLVDAEIVICEESGWVDFGRLQARLSTARNMVRDAARERPAVLMVFDILECDGITFASQPMGLRRLELVRLLDGAHPCLQVVDQTDDIRLARDWLTLPNLEGVVAKRTDRTYTSGRARDWVKVKRQRTVDCVVVGVAGEIASPKLVLALRHSDGRFHHLGLARPSKGMLSPQFASVLAEAGPEESPIRSRWQHAAVPTWRRVPPTAVCEVAYTVLDGNRWLRHAARFLRWRPDRSPDDCLLEQLGSS